MYRKDYIIYLCMHVCGCQEHQNRASDPSAQELQVIMNHSTSMPGIKLTLPERTATILNH